MVSPPCADTFNRLFQVLKPEVMITLLQEISEALQKQQSEEPRVISVDGKTLRGSVKNGKTIHILNAWASDSRLTIGQLAVDAKSNEITHVPQLLKSLNIKKSIITADTLNTQVATTQIITDGKADYVLPLKANHPTHKSVVSAIMEDVVSTQKPDYKCVEKGHGRLETRRCWVTSDLSLFIERAKWPKLRTLVRINRSRQLPDGTESTESALFLSSLPNDAEMIATAVRQHWGVENQCHWCLDVIFREDDCRSRTRNTARNLSTLRVLSLNILRKSSLPGSLRSERLRISFDTTLLDNLFVNS